MSDIPLWRDNSIASKKKVFSDLDKAFCLGYVENSMAKHDATRRVTLVLRGLVEK